MREYAKKDNKISRTLDSRASNVVQKKVFFKIFEADDSGYPVTGVGLTKLGVRKSELTIGKNNIVKGEINKNPQGMSVSDSLDEETQRGISKRTEAIFSIEENYFESCITIRKDPLEDKHFLVGPLKPMNYNSLHKKIQASKEGWALYAYQKDDNWKFTGFTPLKRKKGSK